MIKGKKDTNINLEERRVIQLEMLKEIDGFCRENGIRYSLAYGTLIGAIRHKGFIPWDDDVDIIMPVDDCERFKALFNSDTIKFCDIETEPHYEYAFPRLAYRNTYRKLGYNKKTYGVNIDIYVMQGLPSTQKEIIKYYKKCEAILKTRLFFWHLRNRMASIIHINNLWICDYFFKKYAHICWRKFPYEGASYYSPVGGGCYEMRDVYDMDLFSELINVSFEGNTFLASKEYDYWLRHFYGDYMQLPPIEERKPYHGGEYFWQ